MRIGALNRLVSILDYTETRDEVGGVAKAWVEFAKAWASITPLRGTERWISQEKHATATHAIRIRWIDGVNPKMRIAHDGRTFRISSAINVGDRRKMIDIVATEEV
jgi:SPP1 family predicted phage head-tail adaptor